MQETPVSVSRYIMETGARMGLRLRTIQADKMVLVVAGWAGRHPDFGRLVGLRRRQKGKDEKRSSSRAV